MCPKIEMTRSKESSSNGRSWASPTIQSTSTMASAPCSRATSIRPGDESSPVTRAASLAAGMVALPVPQPTSSTSCPGPTPADSTSCSPAPAIFSETAWKLPVPHMSSLMAVIRTTTPRLTCKSAGHGFDRHRHRRAPPLRRGRRRRRRARRGERRVRARPLQRDHGALGLRQVDADAHPRRARPPDLRLGSARRRRDLGPRRRRPDQAAARQARLHLPVLQPDPGAHRRGEHRAAAVDRGPQGRRRLAAPAGRDGRARATA